MKQLKPAFPLVLTFSLIAVVGVVCFWLSDVQAAFDGDPHASQSSDL